MLPLAMAQPGDVCTVKRIGGKDEVRRFLETLGFVVGSEITVISVNNGNMILMVKGSRLAISREMASKIMV